MTGRPEKIGVRFQDLTVRAGADAMRSLQRYNELLQQLASGDLDDMEAREACVLYLRNETERYFRGLADVSSGYFEALLELSSLYSPPFFERALSRALPRLEAPAESLTTIDLRGSLGSEAVSAFRIHNTGSHSEEVTFAVSEFTGSPGSAPFRPPLRLQPPRFVLDRSESQLVQVRLPLVAGLFVPDERYNAVLTVRKRDTFDLTINVIATAPKEEAGG